MRHAVTIDFHDTLFQCDDWFELEVRDLPIRFLGWLETQGYARSSALDAAEIARLYRSIRTDAIEGGIEVDSLECVRRICQQIGTEVTDEDIERGVEFVMRETLPFSRPRPGAAELVNSLHSAGVKLGVISNAIHHQFLEWSLESAGLLDKFDLVLSSARAGFYKSRVELYHRACELLDVACEQTIHIGDSYRFDVEGAARAGMRTVWLNLSAGHANSVAPDLEVTSLEGLAPTLLKMLQVNSSASSGTPRAH